MPFEILSIELTNRCGKACWFCYNHSGPSGATEWTPDDVVSFVCDCAAHGTKAVSFGGGEPTDYPGLDALLHALRGTVFLSITTHGLGVDESMCRRLRDAGLDKIHFSIHFPDRADEVDRIISQVHMAHETGLRSGINVIVSRDNLAPAAAAMKRVREAGIGNERIIHLPMRGRSTPTPKQIAEVAGGDKFQSTSCLSACGRSPRFVSIRWDKSVAWCSYTTERRKLRDLSHAALEEATAGLGLTFCGGTEANP